MYENKISVKLFLIFIELGHFEEAQSDATSLRRGRYTI